MLQVQAWLHLPTLLYCTVFCTLPTSAKNYGKVEPNLQIYKKTAPSCAAPVAIKDKGSGLVVGCIEFHPKLYYGKFG